MKNKEKVHLGKIARLGCSLCNKLGLGETPCEVHHLREGVGMGQRNSHYLAIGLCPTHHRGPHGIHGDRKDFQLAGEDEMSLLAWTLEQTL